MKIFLAGATGAVGKRLVPLLVHAGHTVVGTTRDQNKAESIKSAGAEPAILDALNEQQVLQAVQKARPDAIIHQLTAIPSNLNMRRFDQEFAKTNELRSKGMDYLLAAAHATGCKTIVAQSYAGWVYARTGSWIKTEQDSLVSNPEPGFRTTFRAIMHLESVLLSDKLITGIVLRYGSFYGPGTSLVRDGELLKQIEAGKVPIVGKGTGYWSFLHIDDAASATVAALSATKSGIYNIADDEPAPVSEWLPFLAQTVQAKPPKHVPKWLAKFAIGAHGVAMMTETRGVSSQKAKSQLQWKLKWPTWRTGFRNGLDERSETNPQLATMRAAG